MLLLATLASTFSAFTRLGVGGHTRPRTSRVDYCNAVLAGAPKVTTDKFQQLLNAAARVVSGTILTVACRGSCTPSYTGWMYLSELHTSWASWCTWLISRSMLLAKHHRPTCFLCGWSVGVEFLPDYLRDSAVGIHIQTTFENVYVRFALAHTAH